MDVQLKFFAMRCARKILFLFELHGLVVTLVILELGHKLAQSKRPATYRRQVKPPIDFAPNDGFVKREPDPTDRRMMSVRLTTAGEHFLQEFLPGHFQAITSLMSPLTETERKTLVHLLGKIQQQAAQVNTTIKKTALVTAG